MTKAFLIMIRPMNLLMIVLTQLLIRFCIAQPIFDYFKIQSSLSIIEYLLMVLATVFIAASGYIINDYFDQNTDSINKPFRLHINNYFSKQSIINIHLLFNFIAIVLAFIAAWLAGNYKLSFIYVVSAGLLWFYSSSYKKMFLLGNFMVATLTTLAVLMPVLFELPGLMQQNFSGNYDAVKLEAARIILYTVFGYVIFAFLTTLIREIVKDVEDIKGDLRDGANTIQVVLGLSYTKVVIGVLWLLLICLVALVQYSFYKEHQLARVLYLLVAVQLPSLLGIFYLWKAEQPEHFKFLSTLLKVIMFLGILSMAAFFLLNKYS